MTRTDALRIARLWAGYHLGDPSWADQFAEVFADPDTAAADLRAELGDDYDRDLRLANRDLGSTR